MSRELEVVNLRDFHSASVLVKRLGDKQIFSIDIILEDVTFELNKENDSSELIELFSDKVGEGDFEIENEGKTIRFGQFMDEVVLTNGGEELAIIHRLAQFQDRIDNIFSCRMKIYMFLQPIGIQA